LSQVNRQEYCLCKDLKIHFSATCIGFFLYTDYPWGSLPVLETDGKVLAQSSAIQRYLAKKFDLVGDNEFETAKADELVEAMTDLRTASFKYFFESDETKKAESLATLRNETFPKYLAKFNETLEKNGGTYLVSQNRV